jgi:hypothetical protein
MGGPEREKLGLPGRALGDRERAPIAEAAALRRVREARRRPGDRAEILVVGVDARHRAEQPDRVRVTRIADHVADARGLDDLSGVHDGDALARLRDYPEVVADENDAHAELGAQVLQEFQDLILNRDVERRARLVGEQDGRTAGERDCDQHALPHPAREFVRVLPQPSLRQRNPDEAHQFDRPFTSTGAVEVGVLA